MNLANWLYQSARSWPERPAIFYGESCLHNYADLARATAGRADGLRQTFGVAQGDRVAIFAENCPQYLELMFAIWWIGAVAVPINHKLHPDEALWIVEHSAAKVVFTTSGAVWPARADFTELAADFSASVSEDYCAPVAMDDGDLAWLFYTSGTTGRPKGVMLSHENLREMSLAYMAEVSCPKHSDHMLYAAPMSHGAGLYMMAQVRAAGRHVIPRSGGFDCGEVISLAGSLGDLVFFAAPTMVKRLISHSSVIGYRGEGISRIIYGGGPMYLQDIQDAIACFGPRFAQIYGQGEAPMTISSLSADLIADQSHPRAIVRLGSVGLPAANVDLAIRDANGAILPTGSTGEITVRGRVVMSGYWQNPQASAEALRDGWLYTGDIGHIDEDGFLYLTDRSKDVIISGGTNIYPREVEEVLLQHEGIFEAAVIGLPDPEWGEKVVACLSLCPGANLTVADLDSWCRARAAAFKRPKDYMFLNDLPKNGYGKIVKRDLRDWAARQLQSAPVSG